MTIHHVGLKMSTANVANSGDKASNFGVSSFQPAATGDSINFHQLHCGTSFQWMIQNGERFFGMF